METDNEIPATGPARPASRWRKVLRIVGFGLLALIVLVAAVGLGINTGPGRAFLVRQVGKLELQSGMRVHIGRIDGSLYSRFTVRDVRLYDLDGQFLAVPEATVDWQPSALLGNHVMLNRVHVASLTLSNLPRLNEVPAEPDQPLFPNIDITLGELAADRIVIGPKVAGQQYVAAATARGALAQGRLDLTANASVDAGDRLRLRLLAEPERDQLDLTARLDAPATGLVAGLAGLDQRLTMQVAGAGQWSRWDGTLTGRLGGRELLDFAILGRNGAFSLNGRAMPALLLEGTPARLVSPELNVRSSFRFEQPRIVTQLNLSTPVFTVEASGAVDTETSRFSMMTIGARLLEPAALMEGVSGDDVAFSAIVTGPMATPTVSYELTARQIGFQGRGARQLHAEGTVAVAAGGRISAPITLTAAAIEGLPEAAGGLLQRLRLNGVIRVAPEEIGAKGLTFRSDRLSGRATFAYAPATGRYSADVDASVNKYAVAGFGVVNASVDAQIASDPRTGTLALNGDVKAEALRLDNAAAQDFLGGLPVLTVSARLRADGAIVLRTAQLKAPRFSVHTTRGLYTPDGRIDVAAEGQSTAYGPFTLAAEGQATRPRVQLALARPDLGLRLRAVTVEATPSPKGYFVALDGRSPQGPLRGRAQVVLDEGPLAAVIEELRFADLVLKGQVAQTEAGPMAGRLTLSGAGLNGQVQLAAEDTVQRVDAALQARQARPPLLPALTIGEASLKASLRLPEDAPDLSADFSGRQIRFGEWRIEQASGTAGYQSGTGKANLTLQGRYRTPFEMTVAADMTPDRAQVDLNGTLAKRRIRLEKPAVAHRLDTGWRLDPATLRIAGGRLTLQGETGETSALQAQWSALSLSFLDAVDPELGFSGLVSGTMNLSLPPAGQTPRAEARVVVSRLQRAGLAAQSPPLDIGVNASLSDRQAAVRALVRHEKAVVGAVQARLNLPPAVEETATEGTAAAAPAGAQDWTARLANAALAGGLRYSGPVELLWALSGMKDHQLGGTLTLTADMTGTPAQPSVRGAITTAGMTYSNVSFGTRVENIKLDARFDGPRLRLASLTGTTPGGGGFSASGHADLNAAQGFPMDMKITLDHLRAAQTDTMQAIISGPIAIRRGPNGGEIEGQLRINEARYRYVMEAATEVPQLTVERLGDVQGPPRPREPVEDAPPALDFNLDVDIDADNRIFIQGMGLDSEWGTDLHVGGTATRPLLSGSVEVVRGSYSFAGRRFDLNEGVIRFEGDFPPVPSLNIEAGATVDGVEAAIVVTGQAMQPNISFTSTPALPQDEILSRLLFGGSVTELSATEALQLGAAVASLQGGGGLGPLGRMRQATNIDRLRLVGGDDATGRGTSLAVGQYLTDDVYVEVASDAHGNTLTQLQIELTRALSILSQVGRAGSSSLQLQYAKDY